MNVLKIMVNEQIIWDEILETFSQGKIRDLERVEDVESQGRDPLEVILKIDEITKQGLGVALQPDFFSKLNARVKRKNLQPLKWRRIGSKRQAIDERITPYDLFREARDEMKIGKYYGGTGWRGISSRENKNFLFYSWIEGWELVDVARDLILVKRYDLPDELRGETYERRTEIAKEISKLTQRKQGIDLLKQNIMKKGGSRIGIVPSRSEKRFYTDMRIDGFPVKFRGDSSELYYSVWFDMTSKSHSCKDKQMFISYFRPREEFFCAHDIAFIVRAHQKEIKTYFRSSGFYPDPYLVFTPFVRPNPDLMDANKRYRKQVFKYVKGKRKPIAKIDREMLLVFEAQATDAKFF